MAISMQGTWTIRVKSKSAAFNQRFVVSGASAGNGVYTGVAGTEVNVEGTAWSVKVEHKPRTGVWVNSDERIKFPVRVGAEYQFDIETNDTGGDQDFNDLILTCSMSVTSTDFLLYGNVKTYTGSCRFNPCVSRLPYVVIDDPMVLRAALEIPVLSAQIEALYPEKVIQEPPLPPGPGPFRPLVIPMGSRLALPPKKAQILELGPAETHKQRADEAKSPDSIRDVKNSRSVTISNATQNERLIEDWRVAGALLDRFRRVCTVESLPDFVLRFQEYDRTEAELTGGAYLGTGDRLNLGETLTDMHGNYVFRFTLPLAEIVHDALVDVAATENAVVQAMPDVIAQVLDSSVPGGVIYESAPSWNVPLLRRIDICFPKYKLPVAPACVGGQIIQSVGNVNLGPLVAGRRTTANTFLGNAGKITSRSSIGPQVNCAAWAGRLYLYACLNNPAIHYYTIRYRRGFAPFEFVTEQHTQYRLLAVPPWEIEESVKILHDLEIDGTPMSNVTCYRNVETDPPGTWKMRWLQLKMKLSSLLYELALGGPGTVEFRIEGYDENGKKIAAADDAVKLYVDNRGGDIYLDPTMSMINPVDNSEVTLGNCALFTLPDSAFNAPIRMKFRADHAGGFHNTFAMNANKGASGGFGITIVTQPPPPPPLATAYAHGDDLACSSFRGTLDAPQYDAGNRLLTVDVTPASGDWLSAGETFCAFRFYVSATVRVTDGQIVFGPYWSQSVLVGIKKP